MLEFRLKPPLAFPVGRVPRINRRHPFFNQQHMVHMGVAQPGASAGGGGWLDLLSGTVASNTTTLSGIDSFGPYIWSNDASGTAAISMTGNATSFNFANWGCIFRLTAAANRQYVFTVTTNNGFWTNGATISYMINNGAQASITGQAGHIYFIFQTNATGTASLNRTFGAVDLTTGQVFIQTGASSANMVLSPIGALTVSSGICTNRLYAGFANGSVLLPPAVNPAATFYSIDAIMAAIADPWSLWYG